MRTRRFAASRHITDTEPFVPTNRGSLAPHSIHKMPLQPDLIGPERASPRSWGPVQAFQEMVNDASIETVPWEQWERLVPLVSGCVLTAGALSYPLEATGPFVGVDFRYSPATFVLLPAGRRGPSGRPPRLSLLGRELPTPGCCPTAWSRHTASLPHCAWGAPAIFSSQPGMLRGALPSISFCSRIWKSRNSPVPVPW